MTLSLMVQTAIAYLAERWPQAPPGRTRARAAIYQGPANLTKENIPTHRGMTLQSMPIYRTLRIGPGLGPAAVTGGPARRSSQCRFTGPPILIQVVRSRRRERLGRRQGGWVPADRRSGWWPGRLVPLALSIRYFSQSFSDRPGPSCPAPCLRRLSRHPD